MSELAKDYLSPDLVSASGLLDKAAIDNLTEEALSENTDRARKIQLDAMINHMLGVEILHNQFIETDIPKFAAKEAQRLNWLAN